MWAQRYLGPGCCSIGTKDQERGRTGWLDAAQVLSKGEKVEVVGGWAGREEALYAHGPRTRLGVGFRARPLIECAKSRYGKGRALTKTVAGVCDGPCTVGGPILVRTVYLMLPFGSSRIHEALSISWPARDHIGFVRGCSYFVQGIWMLTELMQTLGTGHEFNGQSVDQTCVRSSRPWVNGPEVWVALVLGRLPLEATLTTSYRQSKEKKGPHQPSFVIPRWECPASCHPLPPQHFTKRQPPVIIECPSERTPRRLTLRAPQLFHSIPYI